MGDFFVTALVFLIGCSLGWIIEVFFRRFMSSENKERRWVNPGFLRGPWLPLYGFGLLVLFSLCTAPKLAQSPILLFGAIALSMTALEYCAGLISTRLLNTRLWNYSNEWGNLDGLICPKFSLIWAICGIAYYYFLHPILIYAINYVSSSIMSKITISIYFACFFYDLASSLKNHKSRI